MDIVFIISIMGNYKIIPLDVAIYLIIIGKYFLSETVPVSNGNLFVIL